MFKYLKVMKKEKKNVITVLNNLPIIDEKLLYFYVHIIQL